MEFSLRLPAGTRGRRRTLYAGRMEIIRAPLKLSDEQRQKIMSLIAAIPAPARVENQPFTVSVGAAVPQQVPLNQIPTDLASALNGFQGDDYVLVGTNS